jgi:phosphatidylinositol glycan class V
MKDATNSNRNLGLFRYWTLSNLPLFLLGTPMFVVMILSALWALNIQVSTSFKGNPSSETHPVVTNMAVSQIILVLLTLTTAHVQIITRISSAYPVWLWCIASYLKKDSALAGIFVRFAVVYAVIQAGLFSSFLPPA